MIYKAMERQSLFSARGIKKITVICNFPNKKEIDEKSYEIASSFRVKKDIIEVYSGDWKEWL